MSEFRQQLGRRLTELRESRGLTRADLAESLGRNRSTVRSWEVGTHSPSVDDLARMCQMFDCTADFLVWGPIHVIDENRLDQLLGARVVDRDFYSRLPRLCVLHGEQTKHVQPDRLADVLREVEARRLGLLAVESQEVDPETEQE